MPYVKKDTVKKEEKSKGPTRGGLMERTLKELELLNIKLSDIFSLENVTINLSWEKIIRLVNYNANEEVLYWSDTFGKALEVIKIFLV